MDRRHVEYYGPASPAEVQLARDEAVVKKHEREHARWDVGAAARTAASVLAAGADLDRLTDRMFRAVMHLLGYRRHHRGAWRRKQRSKLMSLDAILARFGPKQPAAPLMRTGWRFTSSNA